MSNYFLLELDTTPPQVSIDVPSAIHADDETGVVNVIANEEVGPWQEFYLIDAKGIRHDFIFDHNFDNFAGILSLHGIALGIATMYARVEDTVRNRSALVFRSINIKSPKFAGVYGTLSVLVQTLTPLGFK